MQADAASGPVQVQCRPINRADSSANIIHLVGFNTDHHVNHCRVGTIVYLGTSSAQLVNRFV